MEPQGEDKSGKADTMSRPFSSEIVEIKVGPNVEIFRAHKDVLMARSPFFRGCLRNPCTESGSNLIHLPTDDPAAFNRILKWIYRHDFTVDMSSTCHQVGVDTVESELPLLVKAWVMADKFCMEELKNALMDAIKGLHRYLAASSYDLTMVGEISPQVSPLRSFFVKQMAYDMAMGSHDDEIDDNDNDSIKKTHFREELRRFFEEGSSIAADVVFTLRLGVATDPARDSTCLFHEHKETKKCSDTKA